jgi:hypothetical protein
MSAKATQTIQYLGREVRFLREGPVGTEILCVIRNLRVRFNMRLEQLCLAAALDPVVVVETTSRLRLHVT